MDQPYTDYVTASYAATTLILGVVGGWIVWRYRRAHEAATRFQPLSTAPGSHGDETET